MLTRTRRTPRPDRTRPAAALNNLPRDADCSPSRPADGSGSRQLLAGWWRCAPAVGPAGGKRCTRGQRRSSRWHLPLGRCGGWWRPWSAHGGLGAASRWCARPDAAADPHPGCGDAGRPANRPSPPCGTTRPRTARGAPAAGVCQAEVARQLGVSARPPASGTAGGRPAAPVGCPLSRRPTAPACLAFFDESALSLAPNVRRSWAPRGQTLRWHTQSTG
jgi:hypothetical protein